MPLIVGEPSRGAVPRGGGCRGRDFIRTNSRAPAAMNGTGRDNELTQRRRRTPASGDAGPHARRTDMPIPQVNDRIKEAPVVVLRAVFAGIGQILLTADKVRARA